MKHKLYLLFFLLPFFNAYSQSAPDFIITDIYGNTHNLYSDYLDEGKYVFIDFFSVGCGSCQELAPALDTVFRDFGCNYGEIIFLGIDGYAYDDDVTQFIFDYSMTFPAASGNEGGGNKVFTDYGTNATPRKILISPQRKIIADYPYEYAASYYRDTLLSENINMKQCSGNDFLFYSLISDNDSIVGTINNQEKTVSVDMPSGTDLSQLTANFLAESEASVEINGTEQISGETVNDFSSGSLIYDITSEDGNTETWTVYVTTSSVAEILSDKIKIYPNPANSYIIIETENIYSEIINAEIINIEGKTVKNLNVNDNVIFVDISTLPKNVYFLKVLTKKTTVYKKIIKN